MFQKDTVEQIEVKERKKRTRRKSAAVLMRGMQFDPLQLLVRRANQCAAGSAEQVKIAMELMPYAYPKLKAVDLQVSGDQPVNIVIGSPELAAQIDKAQAQAAADTAQVIDHQPTENTDPAALKPVEPITQSQVIKDTVSSDNSPFTSLGETPNRLFRRGRELEH